MNDDVENSRAARIARLSADLAGAIPQPLDVLEVAAVIESMGITDSVAQDDYGSVDVFALAEEIFPFLLVLNTADAVIPHDPYDPRIPSAEAERAAALETTGRGMLALAPLAFLLLAIQGLGRAGWSTSSVLALSFGVTAAMLVTSGPIFAIGRQTAIYLGFDYRAVARRFLQRALLAIVVSCAAVGAIILAGLEALHLFTRSERLVFCAAFCACAALWALASSLALTGGSTVAAACMAAGLGAGIGVGIDAGATSGLLSGFGTTILLLLLAWHRAYASDGKRLRLPSPGLLVLEALPYVAFGSCFALFLFEPHLLGWEGGSHEPAVTALSTLELSFTLALPPVLIASSTYERTMRRFWAFTHARRDRDDVRSFAAAVRSFHRGELARYAAVLSALSAVTIVCVEIAVGLGAFRSASQLVFLCASGGFVLFGIGQFSCLFMLSLSQPRPALTAVALAALATTCAGVPLAIVDFALAAPAFALGSAVLAVAAGWSCRRVLAEADFHYATAF